MLVNFLLVNFLLVNYILVNFLLVNIGEWTGQEELGEAQLSSSPFGPVGFNFCLNLCFLLNYLLLSVVVLQ